MTLRLATSALLLFGAVALAQAASAVTVTEWAFDNDPVAVNTSPAPSTGTGTASTLGMGGNGTGTNYNPTLPQPTDTSDVNASTPTSSAAGPNQWRIRGGDGAASPGTGSNAWSSNAPIGTQGAQFLSSTLGYGSIQVSFDWSPTTQGEGKLQLQYTLDGTSYLNVPASLFTATGGATASTNTASANTVTGGFLTSASTTVYMTGITANLGSITGAGNDPNFGIRLVNAATGADDTTTTGAALNNTSGNWRFDEVTISGNAVPEPGTLALAGLGLAAFVVVRRRRLAA